MDTGLDKQKMTFLTMIYSMSNANNLVNLGSLTTKFCCLISNHSSSTLHLLYRIMQLRSGHVTLLQTEFQPPLTVPPVGLMVPGGLMLDSAPDF